MPHTNARGKDTQGENHSGVSVIFSMINVKSARPARDKNPRRVLSAFKMGIWPRKTERQNVRKRERERSSADDK